MFYFMFNYVSLLKNPRVLSKLSMIEAAKEILGNMVKNVNHMIE